MDSFGKYKKIGLGPIFSSFSAQEVPFFHIILNAFLKMYVNIGSAKDNGIK